MAESVDVIGNGRGSALLIATDTVHMAEMESVVVLKPVVSRLQPEHALTAFTDYSKWERRPTRTSSTLGIPLPKVQNPKTSLTVRVSPSPAIRQPVCKHGSSTKHTPSLQPPKSGLRPISTRSERGPRLSRPKTREPSSVQLLKVRGLHGMSVIHRAYHKVFY